VATMVPLRILHNGHKSESEIGSVLLGREEIAEVGFYADWPRSNSTPS